MTGMLNLLFFFIVVTYSENLRPYNTSLYYWSFEDVNNNTSSDLSGKKDAHINGKFRLCRGIFGNAIQLISNNSYINFGILDGFCMSSPELCAEGFAVLFWLKLDMFAPNRVVLQHSLHRHSEGLTMWTCDKYGNASLCMSLNTKSRSYTTDVRLSLNEWSHLGLVWVKAKESLFVYMNCSLEAHVGKNESRFNVTSIDPSTTRNLSLILGATRNKKKNSQVIIDEFALWNTTLSREDVCNTFNVQSGR